MTLVSVNTTGVKQHTKSFITSEPGYMTLVSVNTTGVKQHNKSFITSEPG